MRDGEKPFYVEKKLCKGTKDNVAQKTRKIDDSDEGGNTGTKHKIKVMIATQRTARKQ